MNRPAAPDAPPSYALPPLARRVDFIAEAERFAARHRGNPAARFLRLVVRGDERDLDDILGKIWCDSHPAMYRPPQGRESLAVSCLKSLALPWAWLALKKVLWRAEESVDYDFETTDAAYFERFFRPVYNSLPGRKRVTLSAEVLASVTPRTLALTFLLPLTVPFLARLSHLYGRNLVEAYRAAIGFFAGFEGHFRRFPTRHYLAYNDDHNHPCRHLAFRQNCAGRMAVVQNGERTHHPAYAFGRTDDYLSFGTAVGRLVSDLRMRIGRILPVGALYLNAWRPLADQASAVKDIDVLFVDQLVWPYNGFDENTGRSFEAAFRRLNDLKRSRPGFRIVYQLRHYADPALREAVLARVKPFFTEPIEFADNTGCGESYRNAIRSKVVITFNSTLGYEAFFLGRGTRVLFANFAGNPYEIYSDDPRFQLYDESGSSDAFIRHVDYLLALKLDAPPAAALERHAFFDGRVHLRMATALTGEGYRLDEGTDPPAAGNGIMTVPTLR